MSATGARRATSGVQFQAAFVHWTPRGYKSVSCCAKVNRTNCCSNILKGRSRYRYKSSSLSYLLQFETTWGGFCHQRSINLTAVLCSFLKCSTVMTQPTTSLNRLSCFILLPLKRGKVSLQEGRCHAPLLVHLFSSGKKWRRVVISGPAWCRSSYSILGKLHISVTARHKHTFLWWAEINVLGLSLIIVLDHEAAAVFRSRVSSPSCL